MIPLYILGLLLRFGPQHGYQIKKLIEEQLEDFTQIKLPTVYYHLEKMDAAGLIVSHPDKEGSRPEKTVYSVSETGAEKFKELLTQTLNLKYRPHFEMDAVFYFSDHLNPNDLLDSLNRQMDLLKKSLDIIEQHRSETMKYIPKNLQVFANIIFEHHIQHYKAELSWSEQSIRSIKEAAPHDEDKSY